MKNQTGQKLHIRKVTEADAELLFSWANDIDVRRNAFTQREIVWDEHVQWLKKKLADENCLMYIAYLYMTDMSEKPVGQIRLDIEKGRAEIDYSIVSLLRGQGYGTVLLEQALKRAVEDARKAGVEISTFIGRVKAGNVPSARVFEKSGFEKGEKDGCLWFEKAGAAIGGGLPRIVICTRKSWNLEYARRLKNQYDGEVDVYIIDKKEELTQELLKELTPQYVFFPHWSWIIPASVYGVWPCVVFHMTDLPYGRGGSPLQNLIVRGHTHTKLSAIRVAAGMDTGDVYLKEELELWGTADEILRRASGIIFSRMIPYILEHHPVPVPQSGEVVEFVRRKPQDGELLPEMDEKTVYDYIRMLDGEGYPNAFIRLGDYTLRFHGADFKDGRVTAQVVFEKEAEKE